MKDTILKCNTMPFMLLTDVRPNEEDFQTQSFSDKSFTLNFQFTKVLGEWVKGQS